MENLSRISQIRPSVEPATADRQSTQTLLANVFEIYRIISANGLPALEFFTELFTSHGRTLTEAVARLGQFNPIVTPVPPPPPLLSVASMQAPALYASEVELAAPAAVGSSVANPVVIEDDDPAPAPTQAYQGSMAEQIFDDTDLERDAVLSLEAISLMQIHHRTKFQEPGALNLRKHFAERIEEKEGKKPKKSVEESKAELSESEEAPPKMKLRRGQRIRRAVKDFSPSREEGARCSSVVQNLKTTRAIKAGEHLHISYGTDYFRHLGIEPKKVKARD